MRARLWQAVPLLLALALMMALARVGEGVERTSGHPITATPGVPQFHLEIDAVQDGDTFCNPVDTSAVHTVGETYRVAACLKDPPAPISFFDLELTYDDTLNEAPEVADEWPALNDNPDANAGTTVWLTSAGDDLGTGWDCSYWILVYPTADTDPETGPGHGRARIVCESLGGPWMLGDDEAEGVLATLQLNATGAGADTLHVEKVWVQDPWENDLGNCNNPESSVPIPCFDATLENTAAATPTATPTPGPVGGIAELPAAGPPSEEADPPGEGSGWPAATYAALAGGLGCVAVAVAAGALYARRRRTR